MYKNILKYLCKAKVYGQVPYAIAYKCKGGIKHLNCLKITYRPQTLEHS